MNIGTGAYPHLNVAACISLWNRTAKLPAVNCHRGGENGVQNENQHRN